MESSRSLTPPGEEGDSDGVNGIVANNVVQLAHSKQRASILWLISKACNNFIPPEYKDPYYKDHDGEDRLKPQIVQSLASAELYCLVLANIYADPNYNTLSHNQVMQVLMRKGIYVTEPHDTTLTETVLVQTAPIRMSAHMVIMEALMALYTKEVLIPEKVVEVVNRFCPLDPEEEVPEEPDDAALFWINKSCAKFRERIAEELRLFERTAEDEEQVPTLPAVEYLWDLSDGCSLASLLSFYCPDDLSWHEICFNEPMSLGDSIYNLQLVQFFCQEKFPVDIFFLSVEDFLDCHRVLRPNVLCFVADLLFHFEIKPTDCVRRPTLDMFLSSEEETSLSHRHGLNGSSRLLREPDLPTPAEMKAMSLQHSGWVAAGHDLSSSGGAANISSETAAAPKSLHGRSSRQSTTATPAQSQQRHSYHQRRRTSRGEDGEEEEDEELTRYFSAIEFEPADQDSSPELMMSGRGGPLSMHANSTYARKKFSGSPPGSAGGKNGGTPTTRTTGKENGLDSALLPGGGNHHHFQASQYHQMNSSTSKSGGKHAPTSSARASNSHLADYYSHLGDVTGTTDGGDTPPALPTTAPPGPAGILRSASSSKMSPFARSKSRDIMPTTTTPLARPRQSAPLAEQLSSSPGSHHSGSGAISLMSGQGHHQRPERSSSRDSMSESPSRRSTNNLMSPTPSMQKTLKELNDSSLIRGCIVQDDALQQQMQVSSAVHHQNKNSNGSPILGKKQQNNGNSFNCSGDPGNNLGNSSLERKANSTWSAHEHEQSGLTLTERTKPAWSSFQEEQMEQRLHGDGDEQDLVAAADNGQFDNRVAAQVYNVRLMLEDKRRKIEQDRQRMEEAYKHTRQDVGMRAFLKVVKAGSSKEDVASNVSAASAASSSLVNMTSSSDQRGRNDLNVSGLDQLKGGRGGRLPAPATSSDIFVAARHERPLEDEAQFFKPNRVESVHSFGPRTTMPAQEQRIDQLDQNSTDPRELSNFARTFFNDIGGKENSSFDVRSNLSYGSESSSDVLRPHHNEVTLPLTGFVVSTGPGDLEPENLKAKKRDEMLLRMKRREQTRQESKQESQLVRENSSLHNNMVNNVINSSSSNSVNVRRCWGDPPLDNSQDSSKTSSTRKSALKLNQSCNGDVVDMDIDPANHTGVAFVLGADVVNLQPSDSFNMSKKKELIMIQSLKRRQEQEQKRIAVQEELARKRDDDRQRREEQDRKREEEKYRKAKILEDYRLRKLAEAEAEADIGGGGKSLAYNHHSHAKESALNNRTMVLNRPSPRGVAMRPSSAGNGSATKPRPKSLHVPSGSYLPDYTSLDPRKSRDVRDAVDSGFSLSGLGGSSGVGLTTNSSSVSRPQSALSTSTSRRKPSPPSSSSRLHQGLPSLPSASLFYGRRGPPSDGASDAGSTFSEYTGPKLFVKPTQKSNRGIILNAINIVLAGVVNAETKKHILEEINNSDCKHFVILFRGAGLQFRAIYSYYPEREEVFKLHGTGPKTVYNDMIDKFFKYNSGTKTFNVIQTKHLSVTIDAFTIHNTLWQPKKPLPATAAGAVAPRREY